MLLATKSVNLDIKTLLKASIVFVIMLAIALTLNIVHIEILVGWTYNTIHNYRNRQTNSID